MLLLLAVVGDVRAKQRGVADYLDKPTGWYASPEGRQIAANVISWQSDLGGWPKNVDTANAPYSGPDRKKDLQPTFDNGATTDEIRFLARAYNATGDKKDLLAVERGVDHILQAQYPTGGWPQSYPPDQSYHRRITFNDGAMVRLMQLLRELYSDPRFSFLDSSRKQGAQAAFDQGITCILKCQIRVSGQLTAWCAQHDEKDYAPRVGRSYELPSLSGAESVGIVRLLMSLERPPPEVVQAVEGAVAWFNTVKLTGSKVVVVPDAKSPKGTDKRVVADPSASPLWARFYEIPTNRPIFCDRDGVAKFHLDEIGYERRNGYAWLGDWPRVLLEKEFPAWKIRPKR
jgi:PelA/Pel-15E family pectate lyase